MAADRTLLCISGITWGGSYLKSTVELVRELARRHRVLFVEAPESIGPRARPRRARWWRPEADRSVVVLTPPRVPPTNWLPDGALYDQAVKVVRRTVARSIRQALAAQGWQPDAVVHAWNPALSASWMTTFGQAADVYYTYDDLWACPWKARHGRRAERALVDGCDAVVTTAPVLAERYRSLNPNTHLVPNGVDFEAFQGVVGAPPLLPRDGRPVVGYVGSIDSRVDLELLRALALTHPEWHLVVAGPARGVDDRRLSGVPNLTRLGPVSREDLPRLVRGFDVGLVPFVHSSFTRALCPLKIYDYLAAGIGVAATGFAPLDEVRSVLSVGDGVAGLSAAIRRELAAPTGRVRARRELAREASWTARALQLEQIIECAVSAEEETWQVCW